MGTDDPIITSPEEFRQLAASKRRAAKLLVDDKAACREAYFLAGLGLELVLKARIMEGRRLNAWPSSGELITHNVRALLGRFAVFERKVMKLAA